MQTNMSVLLERLEAEYPNPKYELQWKTPLDLLVATILASQCPDERVNSVTPLLFAKYTTAKAYAEADVDELSQEFNIVSFNLKKAKRIIEVCQHLLDRFDGSVPQTMDEMLSLPGVARKTANVVLTMAFGVESGIIVDSHVARVVRRLGLSSKKTPEVQERELMKLVPQDQWVAFGPAVILHGRQTCTYREPRCLTCLFADLCPRNGVDEEEDENEKPGKKSKRTKP